MDMISLNPAISDPVFWNLSHTFTTRELVQLKNVSRTWTTLLSNNIRMTAMARWEDARKDWYFPYLSFLLIDAHTVRAKHTGERIRDDFETRNHSWTWSGIHHKSGEMHPLPWLPAFLSILKHRGYELSNIPLPRGGGGGGGGRFLVFLL